MNRAWLIRLFLFEIPLLQQCIRCIKDSREKLSIILSEKKIQGKQSESEGILEKMLLLDDENKFSSFKQVIANQSEAFAC